MSTLPQDCFSAQQNAMVEIVLRQTDYTREQAFSKLQEYNNDLTKVIKMYLGASSEKVKPVTSVNQQIYSEIRTMMDDASLRYLRIRQEQELIQKQQEALAQKQQQALAQKQQQVPDREAIEKRLNSPDEELLDYLPRS